MTAQPRPDDAPPTLPARDPAGHKGTFGAVAVIGGCAHAPGAETAPTPGLTMLGGPAFTAIAALRAGAGLARLMMPDRLLHAALGVAPSATGVALPTDPVTGEFIPHACARVFDAHADAVSCLAVGPALGVSDGARALVLRALQQDSVPVVLDADGINNAALVPDIQRDLRASAVFTPHPGEFARLAAAIGVDADSDDAPADAARRLGAVLVLKGAATIVTDGQRAWTHDAANPVLATAGTGDVLAGALAGLIAQHHRAPIIAGERTVSSEAQGGLSLYDIARVAVVIHASAARDWADRLGASGGMLAEDLLAGLPRAAQAMRADARADP